MQPLYFDFRLSDWLPSPLLKITIDEDLMDLTTCVKQKI